MKKIQQVPTGTMAFDEEWSGLYIRGADAIRYAETLYTLLRASEMFSNFPTWAEESILEGKKLLTLLRSADERRRRPSTRLKSFTKCLSSSQVEVEEPPKVKPPTKKRRGRPPGSKNKKKILTKTSDSGRL